MAKLVGTIITYNIFVALFFFKSFSGEKSYCKIMETVFLRTRLGSRLKEIIKIISLDR